MNHSLFHCHCQCFDFCNLYVGILVCFCIYWFDSVSGIVLKNAKLTKKGRSKSNVSSGKIVETLVILSSNIVQIVAEVGLFSMIILLVEICLGQIV